MDDLWLVVGDEFGFKCVACLLVELLLKLPHPVPLGLRIDLIKLVREAHISILFACLEFVLSQTLVLAQLLRLLGFLLPSFCVDLFIACGP